MGERRRAARLRGWARWTPGVLVALALGLLAREGRGGAPAAVAIAVQVRHAGVDLSCGHGVTLADGSTLELRDLRFFVHDVRLVDEAGREQPLVLDEDGAWQHDGVALLDLADGTGTCPSGSGAVNRSLRGHAPGGRRYVGARFRLGVPAASNHRDPTQLPAPLSTLSMHWGWQSGFKFFRLDAARGASALTVHLGSTGCSGRAGQVSGCARPNRPEVEVDGLAFPDAQMVLDLARLVVPGGSGSPASCSSAMDEPGCAAVFESLGLDHVTGAVIRRSRIFTAAP